MKKNNLTMIAIISAVGVVTLGATLISNNANPFRVFASSSEQITSITVDQAVTTSEAFTEVTYTHPDNQYFGLKFDFVKAGGGVGTIKGGSKITKTDAANNLLSVKVDFTSSGEFKLNTKYSADDPFVREYKLTSGVELTGLNANYFYFNAASQSDDVVINSITVTFGCVMSSSIPAEQFNWTRELKNHADLSEVFTWDEPLYQKSYYAIKFVLKNEVVWTESMYPYISNALCYLFGSSTSDRIPLDSVRVSMGGSDFVLVFDIFASTLDNYEFFPHLSWQNYYFDNGQNSGNIQSLNSPLNVTYNGAVLYKQTNGDWPSGAQVVEQIGDKHETDWGSYTCWQQWGMACITFTKK